MVKYPQKSWKFHQHFSLDVQIHQFFLGKDMSTTTEMNFRDVATVHSVAGVFFAHCGKSCDLPQRALLINWDEYFCPLR